jgi:hypothetical protein
MSMPANLDCAWHADDTDGGVLDDETTNQET